MGLAHRVIPTILCKGRQMVKGKSFASDRSIGHALQAIRVHQSRGVDEICLLDVSATYENRRPDVHLIQELSQVLFAPLAVGGGVKDVEDVRALLRAGADKVVIGSAALEDQWVVKRITEEFGSQVLTVSIDVMNGRVCYHNGSIKTPYRPDEWAMIMEQMGAGEVLLQDIRRDGTMEGYNLDLIRSVASAVQIPMIASGGCRDYEDMHHAILAGSSAVAAGALFAFTDNTPQGAAAYLTHVGIEARHDH